MVQVEVDYVRFELKIKYFEQSQSIFTYYLNVINKICTEVLRSIKPNVVAPVGSWKSNDKGLTRKT